MTGKREKWLLQLLLQTLFTFAEFFTPAFVEKQKTATNLKIKCELWRVFQDCWNLSLSPSTLVTSCRHRDPLKMLKVAAGKSCLKLTNRMIDSCWSTTFASLVQKWDSSTDRAPFEPWQLPDLRRGSLFLHHILAKGIHSSNCVLQRPPCLQCIQSLQQRIFFKVKILFSGFQS